MDMDNGLQVVLRLKIFFKKLRIEFCSHIYTYNSNNLWCTILKRRIQRATIVQLHGN